MYEQRVLHLQSVVERFQVSVYQRTALNIQSVEQNNNKFSSKLEITRNLSQFQSIAIYHRSNIFLVLDHVPARQDILLVFHSSRNPWDIKGTCHPFEKHLQKKMCGRGKPIMCVLVVSTNSIPLQVDRFLFQVNREPATLSCMGFFEFTRQLILTVSYRNIWELRSHSFAVSDGRSYCHVRVGDDTTKRYN